MTIDWWTLGFQTVNVLILIWLLGHFFFQPLSDMITARKAAAAGILDEAEAARTDARRELRAIEETRAGFAAEHSALVEKARSEAEAVRAGMIEAAKAEAARHLEVAKADILAKRQAERTALEADAGHLAVSIAERLLRRLEGEALTRVFLDDLVREIRRLPEAERRTLTADGVRFTAVSAAPLSEDDRALCRDRLAEALGRAPDLTFETDASLIAGFELKGEHLSVANSWRADLEAVRAELDRGVH
ncbi:F0F1 ATP synthase subunit delta [Jiella avicenniae]|uniref:ATP synthase subunit b n=1 Tax=Jiella avicenniae TaxID=2907202 RepID=A0A9X1P2S9_9HYPH|nr:F0F1 ATP synthase subunit delta [Jiella avicenniae]MCE7027742.1 F0F1 ATP synthase subunit delta [Jiella avicenniae]MCE7028784.1 F0F1 ATP synthase subunit delta [Jiella avicenniae]